MQGGDGEGGGGSAAPTWKKSLRNIVKEKKKSLQTSVRDTMYTFTYAKILTGGPNKDHFFSSILFLFVYACV